VATVSSVSHENVSWSFLDPADPAKGLMRVSANGENCHGDGPRVATVKLPCDPSVRTPIFSVLNDMHPSCLAPGYEFQLVSACTCPGGCHSSMFTAIFFLLIVLSSAYLVVGCLLNNLRFQKSGFEAIPHLEFWQTCGSKVRSVYGLVSSRVREKLPGAAKYTDVKPKKVEEAGLLNENFGGDEFDEGL